MKHAPLVVIVTWQRSEHGYLSLRYETCSDSCHRDMTTVRAWLFISKVWNMLWQLSSWHDNAQSTSVKLAGQPDPAGTEFHASRNGRNSFTLCRPLYEHVCLFWLFTAESTILQSYRDGLNQYKTDVKVSCSRTHGSASSEARTLDL